MKDFEPLPGSKADGGGKPEGQSAYVTGLDGKPSFRSWGPPSREFDEILISHGFTKTDREIMLHVMRRESVERGCDAGLRDMAFWTRTHIDYVKFRLKYCVNRGIILRLKRSGTTSVLRMADKFTWLRANLPGDKAKPPPAEESREEAKRKIRQDLWERIWAIPGGNAAPRKPFERMMDKNLAVFEAVVAEMEDRVKRGLPELQERYGAHALEPVKNFVGMFVDLFGRWVKDNDKK